MSLTLLNVDNRVKVFNYARCKSNEILGKLNFNKNKKLPKIRYAFRYQTYSKFNKITY